MKTFLHHLGIRRPQMRISLCQKKATFIQDKKNNNKEDKQ